VEDTHRIWKRYRDIWRRYRKIRKIMKTNRESQVVTGRIQGGPEKIREVQESDIKRDLGWKLQRDSWKIQENPWEILGD
jgi:hypothetical protein